SIFTWIIVFYALTTEKISAWHQAYHIVAVLSLEAFLVILWLATFAASAARRATFKVPVQVSGCYDDGGLINSKTCARKRALVEKRDILFKSGQAMFSAMAGVGALVWLLFIVTFVYTLVMFLRGRKQGRFPIGSTGSGSHTPPSQDTSVMMMQQQQQQQQQQPQPQPEPKKNHDHHQPVSPQVTGDYQQPPPNGYPSPYQPHSPYQPPPQNQGPYQAYHGQYPQSTPGQYPSEPSTGFQHHVYPTGSELSGTSTYQQQQHDSSTFNTSSPSSPPQELANSSQYM
ncbi:hypothetical protein E4U43_006757, partial [Claviceps pusilla]